MSERSERTDSPSERTGNTTGPLVLRGLDEVRASAGRELGPTGWVEVTSDRLESWARACPGAEAGWLLLSLTNLFMPEMVLVEEVSAGLNIGTGHVLFVRDALPAGARVRATGRIVAADEVTPGAVQTTITIDVHVEGTPTPALTVESLSRWLE